MTCCGYVTCSPWSREHVKNIFRSITGIKIFFGRKTWKDGSFCNLILTPKAVCRYQKCSKKCCFLWFLELFQSVKCFGGKYIPSTIIVVLPYILKNSQKKFWGHYDENFARHWDKTYPPVSGLLESTPLYAQSISLFHPK